MAFNPHTPYNDLPPLFPEEKHWRTIEVLEHTNRANRKLAELKGRLSAIPNPQILINTLSLQEAKDSSSIENVFTTNDKLFKAFSSSSRADPQTKEVLRYGKTLVGAFKTIETNKTFSTSLIEDMYRSIKDEDDGVRDHEVIVGNQFETIYTPPCCGETIMDMLQDWVEVANADDDAIDPLIAMAMLHYQFEAIHPFKDGNGRVGRILNVLYLSAQDLLDEPVLYLSSYINQYKQAYYELLRGVTENEEWEAWIIFILKAVESTATATLKRVRAIIDLFEQTREKMHMELKDIYSHELLEVLFTQVYCTYAVVEKRLKVARNTAMKYLNVLAKNGIVERDKIGNEIIFKNIQLYDLFSSQ